VSPACLAEIWGEIQHKEIQSAAINSVGEGDGGGGTARGDLEMARRLANLEGVPKAAWKKVSTALDSIFAGNTEWPEWRGELYLELHRGTYTTQARTKRYNRRLEFALRNTEWLFATAAGEGWAGYPRELLLKDWKALLTHQFHDIIPGSSIRRVYVEAEAVYQKIEAELAGITRELRRNILAKTGGSLLVFNDLPWERRGPVSLPISGGKGGNPAAGALSKAGALKSADGAVYPLQLYKDLDGADTGVFNPLLPSLGWAPFNVVEAPTARPTAAPSDVPASPFSDKEKSLKTPFYRIKFDAAGRITSLVELQGKREMVAPGGTLNGFVSAQDVPVFWEAWDIDSDWTKYLEEETRLLSTEIAADGPVCFRLRRKYQIGAASVLVQDTVFYAQDPRIDFETRIDWREKQRLLKASFDTAIDATQVRCEVQYGHLLRNTHRNLPHDRAKFEVCAHKWVALEEEGGGIALLNDSKYGHDVEGGRIRLTLLRSPTAPDEEADQGEQRFTYSLLPFTGPFGTSRVVRTGYELNAPAAAELSDKPDTPVKTGAVFSLFSVEGDAVIAECIKSPEQAKAGAKSLAIRLYESLGGRTRTVLRFSKELATAEATDMLEGNPKPLPFSGKELALEFRAFEIKTILVSFR
jgi:alpha-mannosidase